MVLFASCATNKKIEEAVAPVQAELDLANEQLGDAGEKINELMDQNEQLKSDLSTTKTTLDLTDNQINHFAFVTLIMTP